MFSKNNYQSNEVVSKTLFATKFRSSRSEVFCKKVVLRNFAKFTGKHLCQSLFFNKVAGLRPVTLLKKRLWHRYFPVNFPKFLRTPLFIEHIWWLLLEVNKLQWQLQTHKTEHIKALWETTLLDPVVLRSFTARLV